MKSDIMNWLDSKTTSKLPSKESLNHPGLIRLATGMDPYTNTFKAYKTAYQALGIDIINFMPEKNAPPPLSPGETKFTHDGCVQEAYYGLYNSSTRVKYPFSTLEEIYDYDFSTLEYNDLPLPGAQYLMSCNKEEISRKIEITGNTGLYYYQLYTTVFMWGVEVLGWEMFMMAAITDPELFDKHFFEPLFEKSKHIVSMLADLDSPWVFCHDDIAVSTGAVFDPGWYKRYIFPRYNMLCRMVHQKNKKIFFVCDGNMEWALRELRDAGFDGLMFETPATRLEAVIDTWGDKFFIGGISAELLTRATPGEVNLHVDELMKIIKGNRNFAICSSGGLTGNMPLENLEAYFDKRVEYGFTNKNWRK